MPIYNYKCATCGAEKEVLQKHDAPAPQCHALEWIEGETVQSKKVPDLRYHDHGPMARQLNSGFAFTFARGKGTSGGNSMRMPSKSRS